MGVKRSARKIRAALVAGTLAGAIALTGTLAWRNMTQKTLNEALADKNPGGRIHDDFDGVNKDIYAENFTAPEKGAPVFARIRLLEYMEVGEDAGVNRTMTDETTGELVTNTDRKVKVTTYSDGTGAEVKPDINDTSTWYVHKPDTDTETDPFHDYWRWDTGGSTIYMPTFNKNKDSITPEVNGTYVGDDDDFAIGTPYDDYIPYTRGQRITADAYYDADGDDIDENYGKLGDQPFDGIPGAGGDRKDPDADPPVEDPDYEVKSEEHIAKDTLNGLGVITMEQWKTDGRPVCNKWVWDEDGWFYWPEPILPQTATGLLLDKLSQGGTSEKCYYAIEVEGQFLSVDLDWGTPAVTEKNEDGTDKLGEDGKPIVTEAATGFYIDGFTDDARALLEQAMGVVITGENWYLPIDGQINLFQQIKDDEGKLGDPLLAGDDRIPGTADDRHDVVYVEDGVTVNGTDYGQWFLAPRTTDPYYEPYYRTVGTDDRLGTSDDGRIWLLSGEFPTGELTDKIADNVLVTKPEGTVDIETSGKIEMEVGTTLAQPFTAEVKLGDETMTGDRGAVYWEVSSALTGESLATGTRITRDTGILTVAPEEKAAELIVAAKCRMDGRVEGIYRVKLFGKLNVKLTNAETGASFTTIQAGKTVRLQATLYRGSEVALSQPTSYTWGTPSVTVGTATLTADGTDLRYSTLSVERAAAGGTVTFTVSWDGSHPGTTFSIPVTAADIANVTVTALGETSIEAGGGAAPLNFQAAVSHTDELTDTTVTWTIIGTDGSDVSDMFQLTPDDANNTVAVKAKGVFVLNEKTQPVTIKAVADDPSAGGGSGTTTFTVIPPVKVEVAVSSTTIPYGGYVNASAQLKRADGSNYSSNQVTWTATDLSNNDIPGVSITGGVLHVDQFIANGTQIKVRAISVVDANVRASQTVTVDGGRAIIDGVNFLVLHIDTTNNKALILTEECIGMAKFGNNQSDWWCVSSCAMRTTMTNWLNRDHPNIAAFTLPAQITISPDGLTGSAASTTTDKVFPLSSCDIFDMDAKPWKWYTVGTSSTSYKTLTDPSGENWKAKYNGSYVDWWGRSVRYNSIDGTAERAVGVISSTGEHSKLKVTDTAGVRPALWVDITKALK